jgi:hypothetical protein
MIVSFNPVLSLLIVVSRSQSGVTGRDASLSTNGQTAVLLGKRPYQRSTEINGSLAFTNNVKGLH